MPIFAMLTMFSISRSKRSNSLPSFKYVKDIVKTFSEHKHFDSTTKVHEIRLIAIS